MSEAVEKEIWQALRGVKFSGLGRDIVSFGFVRSLELQGSVAAVELELASNNQEAVEQLRRDVEVAATSVSGVGAAEVRMNITRPQGPAQRAQQAVAQDRNLLPEVRHVIAVASGKGGVGKSTVAANLAVSLAAQGHRVGLLDADIYGPSVPMMFGITDRPKVIEDRLQPFEKFGLKVMSLGFVLDADTPVIWRGPMVMKALEQMLGDVDWGALDFMVIDLPPGTGDAQLTLTQKIPLAGAVIVTTPQDVALIDARKGLAMFRKVQVPVIGIVENMSGFTCPCCGEVTQIFKAGGGERAAEELGTAHLGSIPLDPAIVEGGDAGVPIAVSHPDGAHGAAFRSLADAVSASVSRGERPRLSIT